MEENQSVEFVPFEDKILSVATDKDALDWKSFLYDLIYREGLDPWDIDLSILTNKYLGALRDLQNVDFDISGKFLTIAIYLLKTKSDKFVTTDIRGFDEKKEFLNSVESEMDSLDMLDDIPEDLEIPQEKPKYQLKFRNPIARKRKVNIFDLIKTLEKTFEQSNKRRANFLARHGGDSKYTGPMYEKKKKDLKTIIEDLFQFISEELSSKKGHITFSHVSKDSKHKMDVLDKFIPMLHLHNQSRIQLKQEEHFSDIEIHLLNEKGE